MLFRFSKPVLRQITAQTGEEPLFNECPDLIPYPPVTIKFLLLRPARFGQTGRIIEAGMDDTGSAGKERAVFMSVSTNGYHIIKIQRRQFRDQFGFLCGNIHSGLRHHLNGVRIQSMFFDAGGKNFHHIIFQGARPAFRHLAAAAVAGAEKQDFHHKRIPIVRVIVMTIPTSRTIATIIKRGPIRRFMYF